MKRSVVLALAAAALTAAAPAGSDRYSHRPPCSMRGSRELYRDADVRVFKRHSAANEWTTTYACLFASGDRYRVARADDDEFGVNEDVDHLAVRSPWVGYGFSHSIKDYGYALACALNLRTGESRCADADPGVSELGVTRRGSIAWIDYGRLAPTVHKLDAGARHAVVLDSGAAVDPRSFAVSGRQVYWTHDGEPRMARMP